MNDDVLRQPLTHVSAGCHINDVMNMQTGRTIRQDVSAGCHINDVMNL